LWLFLFVNFYVASSWCGEMGNNLFRKLFLSLTSSSFLSSHSVGMHECYFRKCVAYMMMVIIHDCWWCYFLLISSDFFIFFSHFIYYILLRWSKIEMKGMVLRHLRFLRPTHNVSMEELFHKILQALEKRILLGKEWWKARSTLTCGFLLYSSFIHCCYEVHLFE